MKNISPLSLLTNRSGRKTVARILQDGNVPNTLIRVIEPSRSILGYLTSTNNNDNSSNTISEFSFEKKIPTFDNCYFNNTTFEYRRNLRFFYL